MTRVAAGIIVDGGSVLACQRLADADHPGKWEFPGGKQEADESLRDCLRRELREELGIEAQIGAEVWHVRHQYPGRTPIEIVFYAVAEARGTFDNRAFATIRWVPLGSLSRLDFLAADRPDVEALDRGDLVISQSVRLR